MPGLASAIPGWSAGEQRRVSVEQFGALPGDGIDDAAALAAAANYCRNNPGTTLCFPPGIYNISDETAREIEYNAISGAYGPNVQAVLFKPDAPYVKALDFAGCHDLKIDGRGAVLLLGGWYEVVSLTGAEDIEIDGLVIAYKRPPNTVGRVVLSEGDYFEIEFDPERYRWVSDALTGGIHFYDQVAERLYFGRGGKKTVIAPGMLRIESPSCPAVGHYAVIRHSGHYRPAVMINDSRRVTLKNMKIHSQPGMGVVGHMSEDITLDNLQVIPPPGDVISTNTDATHFTSCRGQISIVNCKFGGQGDDCTNIHNYYYAVYPVSTQTAELRIEKADLHALSPDVPQIGDRMELVRSDNQDLVSVFTVTAVDLKEDGRKVEVTFDQPLCDVSGCYMANISCRPSVLIENNAVRSHLARAFLVKSSDVVIRGNTIQGSTGTAIQLGAELSWRESGPVENVIVEDNWIIGCGFQHGTQNSASAVSVEVSGAKSEPGTLNRNIFIRNNVVEGHGGVAFFISSAENVEITGNRVSGCDETITTRNVSGLVNENNRSIPY